MEELVTTEPVHCITDNCHAVIRQHLDVGTDSARFGVVVALGVHGKRVTTGSDVTRKVDESYS